MKSGTSETLLGLGLIVLVVVGTFWWSAAACSSKWDRSGMQSSWGPIQGCVVKLPDGRWLPEERVREIDISRKSP